MKKLILVKIIPMLAFIFISITALAKDPVIVEITTNYKTVKEALIATKTSLMKRKFIPSGGMGESGFTATRTTGSKADYYTADVMADQEGDHVKVTITFIKSGTGMLKLSKVAEEIKAELGNSEPTGAIQNTSNQSSIAQGTVTPSSTNCAKFTKLKKTGKILLISGGIVLVTGIILYKAGGVNSARNLAGLGALVASGGLVLTLIGSKKMKESCALNLKFSSESFGLAFNF